MERNESQSYVPLIGALATALAPAAVAHWSVPPDGVTFSATALTIIAFLLGTVVSFAILLLLELLKSKNEQIEAWRSLARRGTEITDKVLDRTKA